MCDYPNCKRPSEFQVGVARYKIRKPEKLIGKICTQHMRSSIESIMGQCFGTTYWAIVCDLKGKLLYHSYDSDQQGYKAAMGWELYHEEHIMKTKL